MRPLHLAAVLTLLSSGAGAQPRPAATPAVPATTSAAVPTVPQQTTATFGDWVLRCNRVGPAPGTPFCEVAQGLQQDGKPIAEIAIGRPARGQPLQLTVLVPVSVSFAAAATLAGPREGEAGIELAWRRCLPGGCRAEGKLADEAIERMRNWAKPGRIGFSDGLDRPAALPFSPRGLAQALDALTKEDAN